MDTILRYFAYNLSDQFVYCEGILSAGIFEEKCEKVS